MDFWQLQTAKARLSEVIRKASSEGPQTITLHGAPSVVVVSASDYDGMKKHRGSLIQFMRQSPLLGIEIDLGRDRQAAHVRKN